MSAENLKTLAADVEASLGGLGFKGEPRPYTPHLTLGRARGRPVRLEPADATAPAHRFVVRGFGLVESQLGEGGVTYSEVSAFPFCDGG